MKRNTIVILIILAIVILLNPLFRPFFLKTFFGVIDQKTLYDNDEAIASEADSYSFRNRTGRSEGNSTDMKFYLTGMDTIWQLSAEENCSLTVSFDITMKSGQFKVVLISPDNEVETIVEGSATGQKEISIMPGQSRIKIVGKETETELKLSLTGEGIKFRAVN